VRRALLEQYEYDGFETCAVDGSCMTGLPVAIDTGALIRDLRRGSTDRAPERAALRGGPSLRDRRAGGPRGSARGAG